MPPLLPLFIFLSNRRRVGDIDKVLLGCCIDRATDKGSEIDWPGCLMLAVKFGVVTWWELLWTLAVTRRVCVLWKSLRV